MRPLTAGLGTALTVGATLTVLTFGPAPAAAQQPERPEEEPDSTELLFEREVFSYPSYERRNPFVPLTSGEGGPRFEELTLLGVIESSQPELSVALLGRGAAQGAAGQTYRVRQGQALGNIRILDIERSRVIVEVTEFGLTEQRVLELRRPDEGGSS